MDINHVELLFSGTAALVLAAAHLGGALASPPSRAMRSFAGGIGVGYMFVIILPALSSWQASANQEIESERLVFACAMAGFSGYYLLRIAVARLDDNRRGRAVALLQLGGYTAYSVIIGFMLAQYAEYGPVWLAFYTVALGLHLYMNDRCVLRERTWAAAGPLLLAGAILAGWSAGLALPQVYSVAVLLFAVLAGGMILNILNDELPRGGDGTALHFVLGTVAVTLAGLALPLAAA